MNIDLHQTAPKANYFKVLSRKMYINSTLRLVVLIAWIGITFGLALHVSSLALQFLFLLMGVWGSFMTHIISDALIEDCLPVPSIEIGGLTFYKPEDAQPTEIYEDELEGYILKAPYLEGYINSVLNTGRSFVLAEKQAFYSIAMSEEHKPLDLI